MLRVKNALYRVESPSALLRVALGNTELHLQASYYKHATPTGAGDFDDPDTGDRETRATIGLSHRITVSTLLDVSARAYASYYESKSAFIASRGVLCPFGLVTCNYAEQRQGPLGGAGAAEQLGLVSRQPFRDDLGR